jgi:hypothetical protein
VNNFFDNRSYKALNKYLFGKNEFSRKVKNRKEA